MVKRIKDVQNIHNKRNDKLILINSQKCKGLYTFTERKKND